MENESPERRTFLIPDEVKDAARAVSRTADQARLTLAHVGAVAEQVTIFLKAFRRALKETNEPQ